jgi:activator of HSP90 ATPase
MTLSTLPRRSLFAGAGILPGMFVAGAAWSRGAVPEDARGVSHDAASIHQEVVFAASPARVYRALTTPADFDEVVRLSGAMQAMSLAPRTSVIGAQPGAAFSLFGDYITGRQLELTPDVRIVQAWRSASWPAHVFSIARFELAAHEGGAKLTFDHTGFPPAEADSLATGWQEHYWRPLAKVVG